jgi:hypothetical protein
LQTSAFNPLLWNPSQVAVMYQRRINPATGSAGAFNPIDGKFYPAAYIGGLVSGTGRLIDGHARREVVDPKTPVPVLVGSWAAEAEAKILATLDPVGAMATGDAAAYEALVASVQADGLWVRDLLHQTAAGLAALGKKRNPRRFVFWAAALIFIGGFILGPLVQKYAFGVFWSGVPFGLDLTDNKTLITFLFWVVALIAGRKRKPARAVVLIASVVTLVVYLIPHSLLGSELKYAKMN